MENNKSEILGYGFLGITTFRGRANPRQRQGMSQFEPMNPIAANLAQNRQLRHFKQTSFYNYGFLPQTWSDPSQVNRILNIKGDNGPLDVVDISDRQNHRGQVTRVRILGALALMDHGELDWKILALDINDPLASRRLVGAHLRGPL